MHQKPMSPAEISQHEYANAPKRMGVYVNEVDISGKTIVDFGCGWGGETLWLSEQGPAEVIGVDIDESALNQSRAFAGEAARFVSDISLLQDASVDFVFSTNVFEHVMDMDGVLDDLRRILRPGGALISRFGPLFYSPYGCHFYWAGLYPWSHLILGRQWLKRRIDRIRACPSNTTSWAEMGLNRITFTRFAKIVRSKFAVKRLHPIPVYGLPLVTSIPGVRRFMTFGCDMHVTKDALATQDA